MLLYGLDGSVDIGMLQVEKLTPQIGNHARRRDVQERSNAGSRCFDDVLPKTGKRLRACRTRIQNSRGASAQTVFVCVDPVVGHTLKNVRM